jgi:biotin carboxyl carrier protein
VAEGEAVAAGAGVVVIEAMKMENELGAPRAGTVRRVAVRAGDTVERDALLLEIG